MPTKIPPPPRRKTSQVPPPPPRQARPKDQDVAFGHQRRVTLNLLRHAACCPDDLMPILEKLAGPLDWQIDALSRIEKEVLYATVDDALADQAKNEFQANLHSAVDHRSEECLCLLCGHQHIRFEFDLINTQGGRNTKTGSTCIETYGLNVDGEGTAEAARIALHGVINRLKRVAVKEDWQKAHPNHAAEMDRLRALYATLRVNQQPWKLYRHLADGWRRRCMLIVRECRALLQYYDRELFLTEKRTTQFWGAKGTVNQGALARATSMDAELTTAMGAYDKIVARWQRFLDACPNMSGWERRRVMTWRDRGADPDALYPSDKTLLNTIYKQNGSPVIKKEAA